MRAPGNEHCAPRQSVRILQRSWRSCSYGTASYSTVRSRLSYVIEPALAVTLRVEATMRQGTLLRLSLGQRHGERGPRVGRRTHLNVAAVSKHDRTGDEQAEPDTVPRALPTTASERFKDERQDIGRNRWASRSVSPSPRTSPAACSRTTASG